MIRDRFGNVPRISIELHPRAQCLVDFEADFVKPLIAHVRHANEKIFGNKPLFIVGHSMGGLVSFLSLLKEQAMFRGAVLIGPLIEADPTVATPFLKVMAKVRYRDALLFCGSVARFVCIFVRELRNSRGSDLMQPQILLVKKIF